MKDPADHFTMGMWPDEVEAHPVRREVTETPVEPVEEKDEGL